MPMRKAFFGPTRVTRPGRLLLASVLFAGASVPSNGQDHTSQDHTTWRDYAGGADSAQYSALQQINRSNVSKLEIAWTFPTGDGLKYSFNPIMIDGLLYVLAKKNSVVALEAGTGKEIWTYTPDPPATIITNRGINYWESKDRADRRLLLCVNHALQAIDARTGKPIFTFGTGGRVDLKEGLGRDPKSLTLVQSTTPGRVFENLLILGSATNQGYGSAPGDIRAFDVRTGKLVWTFHTIPHPGEFGYDSWPPDAWKDAGAANNWAGMTLDAQRGILYVPTGSAVFDFYGGDRIGNDLFADTLLALDASTGERLWHFQGVHHDIWDRDFPAPPALVTVNHSGHRVDAVAQTTKQGIVYLFDRVTGTPLFPIEEHAYPPSDVPGEKTSLTQPMPTAPAPYARQRLTEDMLTTRSASAHDWALQTFRTFRSDGQFIPFGVDRQTIIFPGFDGGAEWGGPAIDPATGVLYVNANEMAWTGGLIADNPNAGPGAKLYQSQCAICHGADRAGSPPAFPSLVAVNQRLTDAQIVDVIFHGRGRMPALPNLDDAKVGLLLNYLKTAGAPGSEHAAGTMPGGPEIQYGFTGYRKFLDPDGYPAIAPPWGTLSAIDLNTGEYLWKIPLGEYPALAANGLRDTGSENYGGPIVTAGGLVFIAATVYDHRFRAFDSHTGRVLWETELPFAGLATPATYSIDGKQFIVIAASGGRDPKSPTGGMFIAFSLP
jgi:quinoprotein glucose dehydrogenase